MSGSALTPSHENGSSPPAYRTDERKGRKGREGSRGSGRRLAAGGDGLRLLGLEAAVPVEVGIPLVIDGRIAGAIGVSGGTSAQDGQCARAGVEAIARV